MELLTANVVFLGQAFAPETLTQLWLLDNGIVTRDDLNKPGMVSMQAVAQITSSILSITALTSNVTIVPAADILNQPEKIPALVRLVMERLGGLPTMFGFNFHWGVRYKTNAENETKQLFFIERNPLYKNSFGCQDANFGAYLSKNYDGGIRLKLTILPAELLKNGDKILQFAFNFHKDIPKENPLDEIENALKYWRKANSDSILLVNEALSQLT